MQNVESSTWADLELKSEKKAVRTANEKENRQNSWQGAFCAKHRSKDFEAATFAGGWTSKCNNIAYFLRIAFDFAKTNWITRKTVCRYIVESNKTGAITVVVVDQA